MVRNFDPHLGGVAAQGDVILIPLSKGLALDRTNEINPVDGRLILQHGELTGHHHGITVPGFRSQPVMFRDDALARDLAQAAPVATGTARMYRDDKLARSMVGKGILARADLCVGFLEVTEGPVVVTHEEHDGIRLPIGLYYVGRQVESAGAEERMVAD